MVATFDHLRAWVLRRTLSIGVARHIFRSRADRLFFSFLMGAFANFILAGFIPVWLIAVGPLFLGIPHLFSGFRYIPRLISGSSSFTANSFRLTSICAGLSFLVALVRLFELSGNRPILHPLPANFWELASLVFLVALLLIQRFGSKEAVFSTLLVIPILYFSWQAPFLTAIILGIGHHFIAFFYWIKATQTKRERNLAVLALLIFSILSIVYFTGFLDSWFLSFTLPFPKAEGLNPFILGSHLVPGLVDPTWVWRAISAYAFGQALHYFVWLKAIPEQSIRQQVPLSFQQSYTATQLELGPILTRIAFGSSLAIILAIGFFQLDVLRYFYLSISTSHGYLEIAALPFCQSSSRS